MGGVLTLLWYAVLLLIALATSSVLVYAAILHWQHRKYAHIPSAPRPSFFLGHLPIALEFTRKRQLPFASLLSEWHKQFGLVFCFHILHWTVVISLDSKTVKEVMTNSKNLKPIEDYRSFHSLFGVRFVGWSLVNEINHAKWRERRSLFNPAFHRKYVMGFMDTFNRSADQMIAHLDKLADGKTDVAMLEKFNSITLDVIGKLGFGLDLNIIEDPQSPFPVAATTCLKGLQKSLVMPWYPYLPTAEARKLRKEIRGAVHFLRQMAKDCVLSRLESRARGDKQPKDVLTFILDASKELEGSQNFGLNEMIDEFLLFFIAGQETTGNHLAFALQQICRYPDVLKKVLAEIEEVLGNKPDVDFQDLPKLEYLMLVLKETMRQYPSVSGASRITAAELESGGYRIPKGTNIRFNHFVMGTMDRYYDNPEEFRPERFKSTDGESRYMYAYMPFSLGQRNCIGQNVAMIESRVILAKLLRHFTFELVPGQRFVMKHELTNKPIDGCRTYITLRN
ncbi:cholesterol 24-hydroxylase-like [Diadema antillarum]|uniref:cholesterol 24-hydroxylase-like n=1 Tax=Diadema antillarum TaxID=105358 RepID=UPI003A8B2B45